MRTTTVASAVVLLLLLLLPLLLVLLLLFLLWVTQRAKSGALPLVFLFVIVLVVEFIQLLRYLYC